MVLLITGAELACYRVSFRASQAYRGATLSGSLLSVVRKGDGGVESVRP